MLSINRQFCSPNFDERPIGASITHIILHFTEINFSEAVKRLCDPEYKVSSHYIISKDGEIYLLVPDDKKAWHAGKSYWQGLEHLNNHSIGIELENNGMEPFTNPLISSTIKLCKYLQKIYGILPHNIIGHSDIAPNRKIDPGIYFPWKSLAKEELGMFITEDVKHKENSILYKFGESVEGVNVLQTRLSLLGYKIDKTGIYDKETSDVVRAFYAHFCQELVIREFGLECYWNLENTYPWYQESDVMLDNLIKAYRHILG